jgi:hypothetical protein
MRAPLASDKNTLMGASIVDLRTIIRLREAGLLPDNFSVAEIGAQQLSNDVLRDHDIMRAYSDAFGVPVRSFGEAPPRVDTPRVEHLPADAPFTKDFWNWVGCPYVAIDFDTSPHIIPLDLNFDDVPEEHMRKYQLVTNFGTTEHVANQIQAMKIVHDLTALGGLMMHTVPAWGYANHGMINYHPKFFLNLARSCRYHICDMRFVDSTSEDVPLPPNGIDPATWGEPTGEPISEVHRGADTCILVVMQKREDIPFVPPIEIHAGVVNDPRIRSRYWTVLGGETPK